MTIYPASKAKHWPFWQALRAAGVPISASWIDAEFNRTGAELTRDAWARHWQRCIDEAAAADVTLLYAAGDERQMGALVEAGAALASGKMVYAVSPDFSILHHSRVRRFTTLEHAIAAIMAQAAGERAREIMPITGARLVSNQGGCHHKTLARREGTSPQAQSCATGRDSPT